MSMVGRLVGVTVVLAAAIFLVLAVPDLKRYLKLRAM